MWARYSSRKYRRVLNTGFAAVWPRPHRLVSVTIAAEFSSGLRSPRVASPLVILSSSRWSWTVPTRHGTHFPHDSSRQKSMKYLATSTMQEVWSITIMPPGAHDRSDLGQRLVVDGHVEVLGRDAAA